jgi:hypothetical protein
MAQQNLSNNSTVFKSLVAGNKHMKSKSSMAEEIESFINAGRGYNKL